MGTHRWYAPLVTAGLALGLVLTAALDVVLNARLAKRLDLYVFPVMQLLYPSTFVVAGVPTFALLWWTGRAVGDGITLRQTVRVVGVVAMFDSLASALSLAPALYLPGELLLLLGQAGLPFTLLASLVYLGTRYQRLHVLAVGTVLAAVAVHLLPTFMPMASPGGNCTTTTTPLDEGRHAALPTQTLIVASLLGVAMHLPAAASRVYQDYWLKEYDLHPWALIAAVAPVQLVISAFLLLVIAFLPLAPPAPPVGVTNFFPYVASGARCVAGLVPELPPLYGNVTAGGLASVPCDGVGALFGVHLVVNLFFNLFAVALIKHASANLGVLVGVLRIGVSALLFAWPLVAGIAWDPLTPTAVLALVVAALGVATYRSVPELRRVPASDGDDDMMEVPLTEIRASAHRTPAISDDDLDVDLSSSLEDDAGGMILDEHGFPRVPVR